MNDTTIFWQGALTDPSGYGEASRNYVSQLYQSDVDLYIYNKVFWNGPAMALGKYSEMINTLLARKMTRKLQDVFNIMNMTPENYIYHPSFKANIAMTTFETDGLPQHWLIPMRAMDAIITYTDFNCQTFVDAGVTNTPIYKVPHGVDTDMFVPGCKPLIDVKDKYVFGANFDWSERKNPKALLKAYLTSFTADDDVVLVLKAYHQFPIHKSVATMKKKIQDFKNELGITDNAPSILLLTDIVPPEQLPSVYGMMDCYVYPTRGEGWSLTSSEAMSCGLPVITTNWSGHLEFMNDDNSYLVDYKLVDIQEDSMKERPFYAGQKWADIDVDALAEKMLYVYHHQEEAKVVGQRARQDMIEHWTWKHACDKLLEVLQQIGE